MSASVNRAPRIAFVGNCQAKALESLCGHLGVDAEVLIVPPVFDLPAFNRPEIWDELRQCDWVFNQRVADDYACEFARPAFLREQLGERAVSWPNIYFDGYFPGIEYVYTHEGKVVGPLSDYHFRFVRSAWARAEPVDALVADFLHGALADSFRSAADRSLNMLRQREAALTVRMSDAVCGRWRYQPTMFTMNHPDNVLLVTLLARLLRYANVPVHADSASLQGYAYTLNEIEIPAFPAVYATQGLCFARRDTIRGKRLEPQGVRWKMTDAPVDYTWPELFEAYYRLYDGECAHSSATADLLRNL